MQTTGEMNIGKHGKQNSCRGGLLSEDIIIEIFLWLPLKSLNRFKRLSKRWYFLISHQDSNFRFNYLSTLSTRKTNRIIGCECDDDDDAIMAGFFYQRPVYQLCPDRVRFLPATSTQFKKYFFLPNTQFKKYNIQQGQGGGGEGGTPAIEIINNINPFSSLDKSLDKFLSCCQDPDPDLAAHQKVFIAASSNGFLVCSLECPSPEIYYLLNPVTMEWVALPELKSIKTNHVFVGFVCTGDYPSLDLVEYTIVVLSYLVKGKVLLFKFFSNGDNQWREYTCITGYPEPYFLSLKPKVVIVRTTATNSDDQGGGLVVYFLVKVLSTMATAIVVFDLNKGNDLLEMIETPGPNHATFVFECGDFIREFDGVIHYVRIISCSMDFEFWVLNIESRDWCIKHKASLKPMIEGNLWTNVRLWRAGVRRQRNEADVLYHIHAFHPMNPNLLFLTLYGRLVCYNVQTGTLELVYDYSTHDMLEDYYHFVYQWPCWPPLF